MKESQKVQKAKKSQKITKIVTKTRQSVVKQPELPAGLARRALVGMITILLAAKTALLESIPTSLNLDLNDEIQYDLHRILRYRRIRAINATPAGILNITKSSPTNQRSYRSIRLSDYFQGNSVANFSTCRSLQTVPQTGGIYQLWMICESNRVILTTLNVTETDRRKVMRVIFDKKISPNVLKDDKIAGLAAKNDTCVEMRYSEKMKKMVATCFMEYNFTGNQGRLPYPSNSM